MYCHEWGGLSADLVFVTRMIQNKSSMEDPFALHATRILQVIF